jgi:NAD(P)-dependent dehydrogenase (short-subunit alcohol dehydrogenase family)
MEESMQAKKLQDKVAVITGGSSGIGLETAKLFVREGAFVFITGRRQELLEAAVKEIGSESVMGVQGDVSNLDDLKRLFETVKAKKGKIDIYFSNAGYADLAPLGEITEELYDGQFNSNVKGVLFGVQGALPLMTAGSSIIINGSISSSKSSPGMSVYGATKGALRSFARYWAHELGPKKIRVNVVSPGPVYTPGHERLGFTEAQLAEWTSTSPLGRPGKLHEISNTVLFFASDDSSFITGADLSVDGGISQI